MLLHVIAISLIATIFYPCVQSKPDVYVYILNARNTNYERLFFQRQSSYIALAKTALPYNETLNVELVPMCLLSNQYNNPLKSVGTLALQLSEQISDERNAIYCFITFNNWYWINAVNLVSQMIDGMWNATSWANDYQNHLAGYTTKRNGYFNKKAYPNAQERKCYNFFHKMRYKEIIHINIEIPESYALSQKHPFGSIRFHTNTNVITDKSNIFFIEQSEKGILNAGQAAIKEALDQAKKLLSK